MTVDPMKMTKAERVKASLMMDAIGMVERDVLATVLLEQGLPDAWHQVATQPSDEKCKVTIRLDRDVVTFFKAMGPGYQTKMNLLLRAWMHGRLAKVIKGPDATDFVMRPDVVAAKMKEGYQWGETADALAFIRTEIEKHKINRLLGG